MNNPNFPKDQKKEEEEMTLLSSWLKEEKNKVEAPKEVLQKILKNNTFSEEVSGRSSWSENLKQIINNFKLMQQKLKVSLLMLAVFMILVIGFFAYEKNSQIGTKKKENIKTETKLATTTPVINDEKVDASINNSLDEVLNENDFDSELDDVELALSDEMALDDINNLTNDDEL